MELVKPLLSVYAGAVIIMTFVLCFRYRLIGNYGPSFRTRRFVELLILALIVLLLSFITGYALGIADGYVQAVAP